MYGNICCQRTNISRKYCEKTKYFFDPLYETVHCQEDHEQEKQCTEYV